jgi:hypothetical protein
MAESDCGSKKMAEETAGAEGEGFRHESPRRNEFAVDPNYGRAKRRFTGLLEYM